MFVCIVIEQQCLYSSWDNAHIYTAGDGSGNIWIHKLYCSGYEENISACSRSSVGSCNHIEDVGVWCFEAKEGIIYSREMGCTCNANKLRIFLFFLQ